MIHARSHANVPTAFELLESVLVLITGAVLAAAMLAIPYLLARSVRNIGSRRAAPAPEPVSVAG
jgi:hypothetical protein